MGALKKFNQFCIDKYGTEVDPCQHGIGHGLMVYIGYENLAEALDFCHDIQKPVKLPDGCTGGVFMEYNFDTMGNAMGIARGQRALGESLYEPCDKLPAKYQPSCYYEQVDWWEKILDSDWQKISGLCGELSSDKENLNACYGAVGHYAVSGNDYDIDVVIGVCGAMPTAEIVYLCSERAAMFIAPDNLSGAYRLCEQLEIPYRERCEDKLNGYRQSS